MNKDILKNLSYGMYAIGVKGKDKASACISNSVFQVSSGNKICLALSLNKNSYSAECIKKEKMFTVSVLSTETPGSVIGALGLVSGKKTQKLKNIRHKVLIEGLPAIKENTCCWFLCNMLSFTELSDQYIFVGEVTAGSDISKFTPMSYEFYKENLKGASSSDSPIYSPPKITEKTTGEEFVCSVCGYVYSDTNFNFAELEDEWKCPVCTMPKKAFVRKNI